MDEKNELLILDPSNVLVFEGPFNQSLWKTLVIANPSPDSYVAFKLKTTSPRLFYVRPNIGLLKPKSSLAIEVFIQPIVKPDQMIKIHKFLIQSAKASEAVDVQNFWTTVQPEDISEVKLKCELKIGKDSQGKFRQEGGLDIKCSGGAQIIEDLPQAEVTRQTNVLDVPPKPRHNKLDKSANTVDDNSSCRRRIYIWAIIFAVLVAVIGTIFAKGYVVHAF